MTQYAEQSSRQVAKLLVGLIMRHAEVKYYRQRQEGLVWIAGFVGRRRNNSTYPLGLQSINKYKKLCFKTNKNRHVLQFWRKVILRNQGGENGEAQASRPKSLFHK